MGILKVIGIAYLIAVGDATILCKLIVAACQTIRNTSDILERVWDSIIGAEACIQTGVGYAKQLM